MEAPPLEDELCIFQRELHCILRTSNMMEAPPLEDELCLFQRPLAENLDFALVVWMADDELRHYPLTPIVVRLVLQALHHY